MGFRLTITEEADKQLRSLPVREQRTIESAVSARLEDQPNVLSRAVKRLRPNAFAEFELRVGDLRVL
jgi:mRNA-degrading endonuclease RelE of RelBE toxin-antitoxin system